MVAIADLERIASNTDFNTWVDLESTEILLNDWKLIQESEKIWGEYDAKDAYFKGLEYINNLK